MQVARFVAADPSTDVNPATPLVSVVIPVFNGADVLSEAIDSVLTQTYPRIELIIIDDGSADDTPGVVARYGDRVISVRQANQGLAAARNAGVKRSTGAYIAWLDHDDTWMPEKLTLQVAFMQRHPECSVVATEFSAFDAGGFFERTHAAKYYSTIAKRGLSAIFSGRVELSTRDLPSLPAEVPESISVYLGHIYESLIWGNCLHPPTVMVRRTAAEAAGPYESRFGNDSDYEYFLRIAKTGQAAFIDYPLIRYRYSEGQLSADKNLAKIALSLVAVLEDLAQKEPGLRDNPAFKRRVATWHLTAAHALADKQRMPALGHLVQSLSTSGIVDAPKAARTVAKLLMPQFLVERYRARFTARQ